MASLKALFSVFSQTASLQFAQGGRRGDNFKTLCPTSQLSDQSWQMGNLFVSVCSFIVLWRAKVYKACNVLVCKCIPVQAQECRDVQVCFFVQVYLC